MVKYHMKGTKDTAVGRGWSLVSITHDLKLPNSFSTYTRVLPSVEEMKKTRPTKRAEAGVPTGKTLFM